MLTSTAKLLQRFLPAAYLALIFAAASGCYQPKFDNGTLRCTASGGCPSGYKCDNGFCNKGSGGSVADAGTDGSVAACFGPVANCTSETSGMCDPVCQDGCQCTERCAYEGNTGSCFPAEGPFKVHGESCTPDPTGNPDNETCAPGAVCLGELQQACGNHCYRYCRTDGDCGSRGKCIGEVLLEDNKTTYHICSPPIEPLCVPVGKAECPGGQKNLPTFGCYIVSARYPDQTVCDCAGVTAVGAACSSEHECVPGAECINLMNDIRCRKLCALGSTSALLQCPAPQTCTPFVGPSTRYGYCK